MKRLAGTCLLLFGCASDHTAPPSKPPPVEPPPAETIQPRTCAASITLVGATTASPAPVGPLTLDSNGANICAHLDATQLSRAHFAASTDQHPGDASGLAATLQHGDYSAILEGWD